MKLLIKYQIIFLFIQFNLQLKLSQISKQVYFEKEIQNQDKQELIDKFLTNKNQIEFLQLDEKKQYEKDEIIKDELNQERNNIFRESLLNNRQKTIEKQPINKIRDLGEDEQNEQDSENKVEESEKDIEILKQGWLMIESIVNQQSSKKDRDIRDFQKQKYQDDFNDNLQINAKFNISKEITHKKQFYFRLSSNNLYYTQEKNDLIVLGAISISNIKDLSNEQQFCFQVDDIEQDQWILCSIQQLEGETIDNEDSKKSWMCAIYKAIGKAEKCQQQLVIEEREIIKQPVMVLLQKTPECNQNWNYNQNGEDWECSCIENNKQSPIDLPMRGQCRKEDNFEQIKVSAVFRFKDINVDKLEIRMKDNLMTIQGKDNQRVVLMSVVDVDFNVYDFYQVKIHVPAEHTIDNQQFQIEVQAIGENEDESSNLIVSFLGQLSGTQSTNFFSNMDLMDLPSISSPSKPLLALTGYPFNLKHLLTDPLSSSLLDDNYFNYYSYQGSLSYPPCSPAKWIVFMDIFSVPLTVIEMIKDSQFNLSEDGLKNIYQSNRKIIDLNQRGLQIFLNDDKGEINNQINGHFEKVTIETDKYFYMPGQFESGFKGAKKVDITKFNPKLFKSSSKS